MEVWPSLAPLWLAVSVGGYVVAGYALAQRVLGDRRTAERLSGAFIFSVWGLVVTFFVLSPVRLVSAVPMVLLGSLGWTLLARPITRRSVVHGVRHDGRTLRATWTLLGLPAKALLGFGVGLVVLVVVPRTLVLPPLGFDDMTYHLFKTGSWVHASGFTTQPAPDAWSYYDYFPASGEAVWTWFLVPARSGTFLGIGAVAAWLGALLGAFAAARSLGCTRDQAATAAAAVVSVAAVTRTLETSYVDNLHLAGYLIGFVFLLSCRERFGWWPAAAALMAFAFVAGVKTSGLPALLIAGVWLAAMTWRGRPTGRGKAILRLAAVGAVALLVAAPWYVRAAIQRGSPLYPMEVPVLGDRLPGNPQLTALFEGQFFGEPLPGTALSRAADGLAVLESTVRTDDSSWRPAPFLWALGALAGAVLAFRTKRNRGPTAFLVVNGAVALAQVLSPSAYGMWNYFPLELSRLLLPAFASMVLLTMQLPWSRWLFVPQLLVAAQWAATTLAISSAWTDAQTAALRDWAARCWPFALVGVVVMVVGVVARRWPSPARVALGTFGAVLLLVALGAPLADTRAETRQSVFAATRRSSACLAPMWQAVDGREGTVVAVAPGFGGVGHNAHRFPYLGSRLQNEVVYVPITGDGTLVDYRDAAAAERALDEQAFLRRLREEDVAYLAVLAPQRTDPPQPLRDAPEATVAAHHPEVFEKVATATCDTSALYRIRPAS